MLITRPEDKLARLAEMKAANEDESAVSEFETRRYRQLYAQQVYRDHHKPDLFDPPPRAA